MKVASSKPGEFLEVPDNGDEVGRFCYQLASELFPICRSITGPGVRATLSRLKDHLPLLTVHDVPSGTKAFDWIVPDEWTIRDGFVADESGRKIIDFSRHNLHVVGYSEPVDEWLDLQDLQEHLHSLPDQPDAIPYVTSYYDRRWGFCLSETHRRSLKPGRYHAVIDSTLAPGVLNYADLILPGVVEDEILLSTYVCHPSMGNNELSGPVVTTALARWLSSLENRYYTYRIVFVPETIGSIVYLSRHLDHLKRTTRAGFNITCIGDDRHYSYIPSRAGNTLSDQVLQHVLKHIEPSYRRYTWLERGSDERQYCAPGVDLPVAVVMRTRFKDYPEYHTSLDDMNLISPTGLSGGFRAIQKAIVSLENNFSLQVGVLCEPQLGKRNLYPTLSTKSSTTEVATLMNAISYCDGRRLLEVADVIGVPAWEVVDLIKPLVERGLVCASR